MVFPDTPGDCGSFVNCSLSLIVVAVYKIVNQSTQYSYEYIYFVPWEGSLISQPCYSNTTTQHCGHFYHNR